MAAGEEDGADLEEAGTGRAGGADPRAAAGTGGGRASGRPRGAGMGAALAAGAGASGRPGTGAGGGLGAARGAGGGAGPARVAGGGAGAARAASAATAHGAGAGSAPAVGPGRGARGPGEEARAAQEAAAGAAGAVDAGAAAGVERNTIYSLNIRLISKKARKEFKCYCIDMDVDSDLCNYNDLVHSIVEKCRPGYLEVAHVQYYDAVLKTFPVVNSDQDLMVMFDMHSKDKAIDMFISYCGPSETFQPITEWEFGEDEQTKSKTVIDEDDFLTNPNPMNEHVGVDEERLYLGSEPVNALVMVECSNKGKGKVVPEEGYEMEDDFIVSHVEDHRKRGNPKLCLIKVPLWHWKMKLQRLLCHFHHQANLWRLQLLKRENKLSCVLNLQKVQARRFQVPTRENIVTLTLQAPKGQEVAQISLRAHF